jgi:hypothetical protein
MVFGVDTNLIVNCWNSKIARLSSIDASTAIGSVLSSLLSIEEYGDTLLAYFDDALQGNECMLKQIAFDTQDGCESLLLTSTVPRYNGDKVIGASCVAWNISCLSTKALQGIMQANASCAGWLICVLWHYTLHL